MSERTETNDLLSDGIFNFVLSHRELSDEIGQKINFGDLCLCSDIKTPVSRAISDEREILLFGLAVDVRNGTSENLPQRILETTNSLQEVIRYEYFLGGKYILFYREGGECYALPDATASIPFCYTVGKTEFMCSSVSEFMAKQLNLNEDPSLKKIRVSSEISQAMPFDLTVYKEIKQLLPNHYFSFKSQRAERFVNETKIQSEISPEKAAEITSPFIEKIAELYTSRFKPYCPITAGRDSRAVLAFLRSSYADASGLQCYTIKHKNHIGDEQDLTVPRQLSEKFGLKYEQIKDIDVSDELKISADELFGKGKYSERTLLIANTVYKQYGDGAVTNGDIIGQVGKCSLHRDISERLATAGYFRCKLHNYSRGAKSALKEWMNEIKASEERVNLFDLFSVENRMGRWAAQENLIYNTVGQAYLNIFNSRSIIYVWTAVSRKERKKSALHIELIKKADASLLEIPFEKEESRLVRFSKSNGVFYYLFSYLKYWVKCIIFYIKRGL